MASVLFCSGTCTICRDGFQFAVVRLKLIDDTVDFVVVVIVALVVVLFLVFALIVVVVVDWD